MIGIALFLSAVTGLMLPAVSQNDGDWHVSDTTDNVTGERTVYAFATHLERDGSDYVTLTMRCSKSAPTLFVLWDNLSFPAVTALSIGAVTDSDGEPVEEQYVFERSIDPVEQGLRASPQASAAIAAALGPAKYATVTAHVEPGRRTVGIKVDGTRKAWDRISRHCPIRTMATPAP